MKQPQQRRQLLDEAMSRRLELFPNLDQLDDTGQANSEDDKESAEMIGDASISVAGDDNYIRKIAADVEEEDTAEQVGFISVQIALSDELDTKLCDQAAEAANHVAVEGERIFIAISETNLT